MNGATEFAREIEVASRLAREAGDAILKIYATDFAVHYKAKRDPVTEADRLASCVIVNGLRRKFPEDLVISEEEPIDPLVSFPDRVWFVDPLDGTREFIKRNGEFAVMIGLAVEGCAHVGGGVPAGDCRVVCRRCGAGGLVEKGRRNNSTAGVRGNQAGPSAFGDFTLTPTSAAG